MPIELDLSWQHKLANLKKKMRYNKICYKFGKPGHFVNDCQLNNIVKQR